jgi:hypothetical protein
VTALQWKTGSRPTYSRYCLLSSNMDPYEQTQSSASIPDEYVDEAEQFKELEAELAPKAADFYGILNISKEVR